MSEHAEQKSFFAWTEILDKRYPALGRFFAVPNGGKRSKGTAGKLKAEGVRAGVPDVFNLSWAPQPVLSDDPRKGYVFFKGLVFEFKSDTGRLTREQRDWCQYLRDEGYRVEVPRSWIEAALITIDYFGLPALLEKDLPLHRLEGK